MRRHPFLDEVPAVLIGADARGLDALLPDGARGQGRVVCEAVSIPLHDLDRNPVSLGKPPPGPTMPPWAGIGPFQFALGRGR